MSREALTVDKLKSLTFDLFFMSAGISGQRRSSKNDEWGISVATETNGGPNYVVKSKTISMINAPEVSADILKKPIDLDGFVAAYNAKISQQQTIG